MYERILVPTDGSDAAGVAVEHAIELASFVGARLYLLYVIDTSATAGVPRAQSGTIADILEDAGRQAIDDAMERAQAAEVPTETEIREGPVSDEIIAAAGAADADLIVMGTHGRSGIDRVLLGSVTDRVLKRSDCPVLVKRDAGST